MSWRTAKCLDVLLHQVDAAYPGRDKSNDGTIGDAAHAATKSEHNPDANGIVRARDITHDPTHGLDARKLAEALIASRDNRILYVISNAQICSSVVSPWVWRPYSGVNAHRAHMHLSVVESPSLYDDERPWKLDGVHADPGQSDPHPLLKLGSSGPAVNSLQQLLAGIEPDGYFGPKTDAAVRIVQAAHGLEVDGIVGSLTWAALVGKDDLPPPRTQTSKGSWYSQYKGKYNWVDNEDAPNSAALGVPDDAQGVAMPPRTLLGNWYMVRAPNGKVSLEQVTDLGPSTFTGRTIDISAVAAERFGYSPQNFPTDQIFTFWPVDPPAQVAGLSKQQQAIKYRDLRKDIKMAEPTEQPKPPINPVPQPKPTQPQVPAVLSPKLDVLQGLHYIVSGQRDKVREDLKLFLDVFNSKHPDAAIALPTAPAPAPSSGSLLDRPSVQLGGIGLAATGILHTVGMLDPNLTLLAGIVSVATAALGPAGGILGKVIMNIARSAMAASQNKPPS